MAITPECHTITESGNRATADIGSDKIPLSMLICVLQNNIHLQHARMLSKVLLLGRLIGLAFHQLSSRLHLRVSALLHRLTYRVVANPRDIVVIGASFAGYHAAYCLAHSVPTGYRVTVVEKNSHFQLTWVLPRFCAVPGHEHKAFIPYGPYLARAPDSYRWVTDEVTAISPLEKDTGTGRGTVQLRSGESIDYDYLVLATGSSAKLPSRVGAESKPDGMEAMQNEQQHLKDNHDIVVVGGGPAGIELAADVKTEYPDKQVTLVHSHGTLLNAHFGANLRQRVLTEVETLGVRVILGERASESEDKREVILSSGERIPCDCLVCVPCPRFTKHADWTGEMRRPETQLPACSLGCFSLWAYPSPGHPAAGRPGHGPCLCSGRHYRSRHRQERAHCHRAGAGRGA